MALFYFNSAFDLAALDFRAPYGPGHVAVTLDGDTFAIPEVELPLPGGTVVTVPGAEIVVPEIVAVQLGDDQLAVGGAELDATSGGLPRGGTVSYMFLDSGMNFQALGLSISGAAFAAAAKSASTEDDQALFQATFAGNDLVYLSDGDDRLNSGAGRDLISGGAGNDVLTAAGGNDLVLGGDGGDSSYGGLGNDLIIDLGGNNLMSGGAGRDVLVGGPGRDTMAGGDGVDTFVFGTGRDVVRDFADGEDRILIMAPGVKFSDLTIDVLDSGVRISLGGGSLLLQHLGDGALSAADFILGRTAPLENALAAFFDGWSYV